MSNRFWFWWNVGFALFSAVMIPVTYLNDGSLYSKIWYPIAVPLFSSWACVWFLRIKEENERS